MRHGSIHDFYAGSALAVPSVEVSDGRVADKTVEFVLPEAYEAITEMDIAAKLDELNRPPIVVEQEGYQFEFVTTSAVDAPTNLFISTISSGATNENGPGNMFEQAFRAVAKEKQAALGQTPAMREVYVSSPGNGATSQLSSKELKHFARTGRLVDESGGNITPLPFVRALRGALEKQDLVVEAIGADSAGGVAALALAATAGANIKRMFQNGRPQMVDLSRSRIIAALLYESRRGTKLSESFDLDRWAVTESRKQQAVRMLPEVFRSGSAPKISAEDLLYWGRGLRLGPKQGDPLLRDLTAVVRANPGLDLTMVHAAGDKFLSSSLPAFLAEDYPTGRAEQMATKIAAIGEVTMRFMALGGGTNHSWHSYLPGLRVAAESIQ